MDLTIGRKGLLGYLKALGGSNVVKVTPSNGSASGSQANGHKRLKVICGGNTSYLTEGEWIGEKTPLTFAEVRVSPSNTVKPNVGAGELAEALARVLPFTARDDKRPVLQCVNCEAKDGKLTLVSADGFRLAVTSLDYDDGEGQAIINRDDLKGIANALKRAKRAKISFEGEDVTKPSSLIIDTELIRYKWTGVGGNYPEWQRLIPKDFNSFAQFDTVEAIKAVNSLKVLADSKGYPVELAISNGKLIMANPDDKGQAEISADTEGEAKIRVDGGYLAQTLKACSGMVELKLTNAYSPMLFASDDFQVVVMLMLTTEATEQMKKDKEAKGEAVTAEPEASQPEVEGTKPEATEPVAEHKPKRSKRSRVKEPVAVK